MNSMELAIQSALNRYGISSNRIDNIMELVKMHGDIRHQEGIAEGMNGMLDKFKEPTFPNANTYPAPEVHNGHVAQLLTPIN